MRCTPGAERPPELELDHPRLTTRGVGRRTVDHEEVSARGGLVGAEQPELRVAFEERRGEVPLVTLERVGVNRAIEGGSGGTQGLSDETSQTVPIGDGVEGQPYGCRQARHDTPEQGWGGPRGDSAHDEPSDRRAFSARESADRLRTTQGTPSASGVARPSPAVQGAVRGLHPERAAPDPAPA